MGLGNRPRALDTVLLTTALDRVLEHEPADLTATVEAGIPLGELNARLERQGQFLPLEAPEPGRATIGGLLATAWTGPRRLRYGPARDWVIGLKAALPDGTLARSGGKVVKNVAGYDLAKLHIGGLGTLGVIAEVSFKVLPLPAARATIAAGFGRLQDATSFGGGVLAGGLRPTALELLNAAALAHLGPQAPLLSAYHLALVEFAGAPTAVTRQIDDAARLARESQAGSVTVLDGAPAAGLWQAVLLLGQQAESKPFMSTRATVLPATVERCLEAHAALGREHALAPAVVGGLGTGVVQAHWWPAGGGPALADSSVRHIVDVLVRECQACSGALVVTHAPPAVKAWLDIWGSAPAALALMRTLKQQFDPTGTLNPGRFVGGI